MQICKELKLNHKWELFIINVRTMIQSILDSNKKYITAIFENKRCYVLKINYNYRLGNLRE